MSQSAPPPPGESLKPLLDAEAANRLGRQLDNVTWGLLLFWLGIAWFSHIGWYRGMIGIGVIFLGESALRGAKDLKISGGAVLFGTLFLVGGIWGVTSQPFALLPTLFVLFGIAMVWRAAASFLRRG